MTSVGRYAQGMRLRAGDRAVVTGASRGIGACFALELARRGVDLLLIARSEGDLQRVVAECGGVKVDLLAMDLARELPTVEQLGRVDLLVNNAGFGLRGVFADQPIERLAEMIELNVSALVKLTHLTLPQLIERGRGGVLNVASNAAFQPLPYMAIYGATKSFVLSFSEALHVEVANAGVTVLGLCPGGTKTDFHAVAGNSPALASLGEEPEAVVRTGLRALEQGRASAVSGWYNAAGALMTRLVPRHAAAAVAGKIMEPR